MKVPYASSGGAQRRAFRSCKLRKRCIHLLSTHRQGSGRHVNAVEFARIFAQGAITLASDRRDDITNGFFHLLTGAFSA
jgi:hypothetical protein